MYVESPSPVKATAATFVLPAPRVQWSGLAVAAQARVSVAILAARHNIRDRLEGALQGQGRPIREHGVVVPGKRRQAGWHRPLAALDHVPFAAHHLIDPIFNRLSQPLHLPAGGPGEHLTSYGVTIPIPAWRFWGQCCAV